MNLKDRAVCSFAIRSVRISHSEDARSFTGIPSTGVACCWHNRYLNRYSRYTYNRYSRSGTINFIKQVECCLNTTWFTILASLKEVYKFVQSHLYICILKPNSRYNIIYLIYLYWILQDKWYIRFLSCLVSDWIAVVTHSVNIEYALESNPLQIKTNNLADETNKMVIILRTRDLYGDDDDERVILLISNINGQDASQLRYSVDFCHLKKPFPLTPEAKLEMVWTFTKTATAIIFDCNGVEVLNYIFSESAFSRCTSRCAFTKNTKHFLSFAPSQSYYIVIVSGKL